MMTDIEQTGFKRLETEGRLLNPLLKAPTKAAGRFGFRGDLALKFADKLADEARPPELAVQQVMAVSQSGDSTITFFAAYLLSFEYLQSVAEVLGPNLTPNGKYFVFCNNIDISTKYRVVMGGIHSTCSPSTRRRCTTNCSSYCTSSATISKSSTRQASSMRSPTRRSSSPTPSSKSPSRRG